MLVDVLSVAELAEGRPRVVKVGGREIALVRWRGTIHAVRNVCPHQTQSLTAAIVRADIDGAPGQPGELKLREDRPVIVCPFHTWEFSLTTGQCLVDSTLRIKRYDTVVEGDRLLVDVST